MNVISIFFGVLVPVAGLYLLYYLIKGNSEVQYLGNWSNLDKHFNVDSIPTNYRVTSGMVGGGHYQGTLRMAFDDSGVFIDIPALVRGSNKPLHIPYHEFTLTTKFPFVNLGFRNYKVFIVRRQLIWLSPEEANIILAHQHTHPD